MSEQTAESAGAPRFEHDHDCVFLGPCWGGEREYADLYWCDQGGWLPTVIARFSSADSDYTSGMVLADHDPYLAEAKRRAEDRDLRTPPGQDGAR